MTFLKDSLSEPKRKDCHQLYERLGGESESSHGQDEHLEYTNVSELVAKIGELETELFTATSNQVKRVEKFKADAKSAELKHKEDTKRENADINEKAEHIKELKERLVTLTMMSASSSKGSGAGGGGGGGSGGKRPPPPSAQPKVKKSITLPSLLKTMRETSEGTTLLDLLEGDEVNGAPALADDEVTGKPFTLDELEEHLPPRVFKFLKANFLGYLINFGIVKEEDDEDDEDDEDGEAVIGGDGGGEDEGEGEDEGDK